MIRGSGAVHETEELRGERLRDALLEKLVEEHAELLAETNPEEIIDMIEVLLALADALGCSEEETFRLLWKKREEHGGFGKGHFLIGVDTPTEVQDE